MSLCDRRGARVDPDDWNAVAMPDQPEPTADLLDIACAIMTDTNTPEGERVRLVRSLVRVYAQAYPEGVQ